jgi:SAM-dependent methyltransferase
MTASLYYDNVNQDVLQKMPPGAGLVVEAGVGAGKLGHTYLQANPGALYCGFEYVEEMAVVARDRLSHVISGDIESAEAFAAYDAWAAGRQADLLVFGDVLEHLRDPWALLKAFRARVSTGGRCVACIPNVSNWSLVIGQLRGEWTYADSGLLDRTHLRFFTLDSAVDMFKSAGWTVTSASARVFDHDQTRKALEAFEPLVETIGISREKLRRNLSAFQWVIEAKNPG